MSSIASPLRSRIRFVAGIGPVSINIGSSPTTANEWNRARGVSPSSAAFSSLMISTADAASVSGDELPGVMRQSSSGNRAASASVRNDGLQPGQCPRRSWPARTVSSNATVSGASASTGSDLRVERAPGPGIRRPSMRLGRERVELLAAEAPLAARSARPTRPG